MNWRARGDALRLLMYYFANHQKLKGPFGDFFLKNVSQCQKTERGDPLGFCNIQSPKKLRGTLLGELFFFEKSLNAEKTE